MPPRPYKKAIVWLRRDLRSYDHRPLALATELASEVYVVFIYDTVILDQLTNECDKRLQFIYDSIEELDNTLSVAGGGLMTGHGDPAQIIPKLCAAWGAEALFFGHDDDPYALTRDRKVTEALPDIDIHSLKDHVVFERQEVLSQAGEPMRVYTPYSRAWMSLLTPDDIAEADPDLSSIRVPSGLPGVRRGNHSLSDLGFVKAELWLKAGEKAGQERLHGFGEKIAAYHDTRNFPDTDGTSGLSVHLRFGTVSIRECVRVALARINGETSQWLKELIWREFYHMILANFPHVVTESFRPEYESIHWPGSEEHFQKWCEGQTGYPIVDAAMRCLNETGWMHNRLRMVVAMFLTKDLLVDWRKGEAYFAAKLLDFELASNNGGWQWSASTGCDAQPYFRIFNPILQSVKFLGDGEFLRRWVPELRECDDEQIHWPHDLKSLFRPPYPAPLVNHHDQKEKVLGLFKR